MSILVQAIKSLRPGANFAIQGDDRGAENIIWLDTVQTRPSDSEIETAKTNVQNAITAEAARVATFTSDIDRADILNRLKTATASQIKSYINTNVTDLASAKLMLSRILVLIALDVR